MRFHFSDRITSLKWDSITSLKWDSMPQTGKWPLPVVAGRGGLLLVFPLGAGGSRATSSWGIWATFCRKIFSRAWAISTMSSVGYTHRRHTKHPSTHSKFDAWFVMRSHRRGVVCVCVRVLPCCRYNSWWTWCWSPAWPHWHSSSSCSLGVSWWCPCPWGFWSPYGSPTTTDHDQHAVHVQWQLRHIVEIAG